ncbi:SseB family protein [Salmonella enterica subsp. enterica]|nr:SseB family protein [Salmonella enterica subsp. enterica]
MFAGEATEPRIVRHFFRTLLESTVWVRDALPKAGDCGRQRSGFAALGKSGTTVIPFFTSTLEALRQAVETNEAFVVMPARTLFENDAWRNAIPQL